MTTATATATATVANRPRTAQMTARFAASPLTTAELLRVAAKLELAYSPRATRQELVAALVRHYTYQGPSAH